MNIFLLALAIIVAGGTMPLLTHRHPVLTRWVYLTTTVVGCMTGLFALFSTAAGLRGMAWSWSWMHGFALAFSCDSLSWFFLLPIFLICPLAAVYSFAYFAEAENSLRTAVSFFCTNLLIAAIALLTVAANILAFVLVWEIMSLSSYILVMYDYEKAATRTAGYLYFLFAQAGALLIFASFGVVFSHTGSLAFARFAAIPAEAKIIVFFLAFLGFASKAGVFPLHVWLPHAHPAAPSHISAIMSGVMIKMGIYGILPMYSLLATNDLLVGQVVLVFGMISGVLGVLYALGKHNLKRLLAYHSVEYRHHSYGCRPGYDRRLLRQCNHGRIWLCRGSSPCPQPLDLQIAAVFRGWGGNKKKRNQPCRSAGGADEEDAGYRPDLFDRLGVDLRAAAL